MSTHPHRDLLYSMSIDEQEDLPRPKLLALRRSVYTEHVQQMTVREEIQKWAATMQALFPKGVKVWENKLPWLDALMVVRYGEDTRHWPEEFSDDDVVRAKQWLQGKSPSGSQILTDDGVSLLNLAFLVIGAVGFIAAVLGDSSTGLLFLPFLFGSAMTDYLEAQMATHLMRTGLTTLNAWAVSTSYSLGDIVRPTTWNHRIYQCVGAGTSGGSEPSFATTIGNETTDNGATWLCCAVGLPKRAHWIALFTAAPGETGGGTEVVGGSYGRVNHTPSDANWTAAGTNGLTDNATTITFPAPTGNWGTVSHIGDMERASGGNMMIYGALAQAKTVNASDPAPTFPVGTLDFTFA